MSRFLLASATLIAVAVLGGCGSSNGSTTTTTGATTTTTSPAEPVTVSIVVQNGAPKGGIVRASVNKGDHVVLVVKSDVADEIHLHGYDTKTDVDGRRTARLPFIANIPGRFEVELESRGVQIADLTVELIFLAHGIGGVRDLPVPESFFFTTAAIVLVVSFVLLGLLWKRPLLERSRGRTAPPRVTRRRPALAARCGWCCRRSRSRSSLSTFVSAAFGTTVELLNFAPTFVYVVFWLGVPLLSVLFGNVWRALGPWRAIADGTVWLLEASGRQARPLLESGRSSGGATRRPLRSSRSSRWSSRTRGPRTRGRSRSRSRCTRTGRSRGMAVYGREAWTRSGEGFAVAFGLLVADRAVRRARRPGRPALAA